MVVHFPDHCNTYGSLFAYWIFEKLPVRCMSRQAVLKGGLLLDYFQEQEIIVKECDDINHK